MNIIAIDCGASFLKAALFKNSELVKQIHKQSPKVNLGNNVYKPSQISLIENSVREVLMELTQDIDSAVVCISNEMHGFLLADKNGDPITDYISWQKELGNIKVNGITSKEVLESQEYEKDILYTGMPVRAGLPSSNLLYLKQSGFFKENYQFYFYTLGDYLIRTITGKEPNCHITNAAATGLVNLLTNNWNIKLINVVCGKNVIFPEIGKGSTWTDFNKCKLLFLPAIGDQQAALIGAGFGIKGDMSFNLGTGAQVSAFVQEIEFSNSYQLRPFLDGNFIKSIPHLPSGRAVNVFIRFIEDITKTLGIKIDEELIWKSILLEVDNKKKTELRCDLSFFENPITNYVVGSITNISEYGMTTSSLFQSIFTQMTNNFLWAANTLEPDKSKITRIVFSGGIAKRIEYIRNNISQQYPDAIIVVAPDNETIYGLLKYGAHFFNDMN